MENDYNAQDNADLTRGLSAGQAHVMPSASIMKGGLAGLSFLEIAVIGGAAFVLFRNRERLMGYLEQSGIDFDQVKKQIGQFLNKGMSGQSQNEESGDEQEFVGASASRAKSSGRASSGNRKNGRGSSTY